MTENFTVYEVPTVMSPPPTVTVEADKTVNTSTTTLSGTATAGSGETITSTTWSKTSGGSYGISGAGSLTASVNGLSNGSYTFRLTATQSDSQTAFDEVSVTVAIPAPTVNAGNDTTVTVNNTTITGSATPASGETITTYSWTKISGTGILSGYNTPTLSLWNLGLGTSVYRLTVTQSDGQTAFDDVSVTYNSPPTVPSSVQTIELPAGKRIFIND